jgi:hypothetical protein
MTGDAPSVEQGLKSKNRMRRVSLFAEEGHPRSASPFLFLCFHADWQISARVFGAFLCFIFCSSSGVVGYCLGRFDDTQLMWGGCRVQKSYSWARADA